MNNRDCLERRPDMIRARTETKATDTMAEKKDERGYDIFINGIKRSYRDELAIAEEAVRYFRRNASNADVTLFDRKQKAFLLVDGA